MTIIFCIDYKRNETEGTIGTNCALTVLVQVMSILDIKVLSEIFIAIIYTAAYLLLVVLSCPLLFCWICVVAV